jgi:hypothetical protein
MENTNENEKPSKENWDDFSGDYLKPEIVKEWPLVIAVIDIETEFSEEDGKPKLTIHTEYNTKKKKFTLNKTNLQIVKKFCKTPKELIGKKLTCSKIKQRNPVTNTMVDSILIETVE